MTRRDRVLQFIGAGGPYTLLQISEGCGISLRQAEPTVVTLRRNGFVERSGKAAKSKNGTCPWQYKLRDKNTCLLEMAWPHPVALPEGSARMVEHDNNGYLLSC